MTHKSQRGLVLSLAAAGVPCSMTSMLIWSGHSNLHGMPGILRLTGRHRNNTKNTGEIAVGSYIAIICYIYIYTSPCVCVSNIKYPILLIYPVHRWEFSLLSSLFFGVPVTKPLLSSKRAEGFLHHFASDLGRCGSGCPFGSFGSFGREEEAVLSSVHRGWNPPPCSFVDAPHVCVPESVRCHKVVHKNKGCGGSKLGLNFWQFKNGENQSLIINNPC